MNSLLKKMSMFALAASMITGLAACNTPNVNSLNYSSDQVSALSKNTEGQKKWTIMVHLAADNNLYPFGLEDLNEMEAGLKGVNPADVNIVVLFDGTAQGDSAVYEVKEDPAGMNKNIISPKVDNPIAPAGSEIDSGNKDVAGKFVDWATTKYPADHFAYIIWNHGAGWQRQGTAKNGQIVKPIKNASAYTSAGDLITKEFAWDDHGGHMSTLDLNNLLEPVAKKLGRKIDILDFDACLMAHAEVAYQIRNSVDFLVASEKTEPGAGNPYHDILNALSKNPSATGAEFATSIVKAYGASYNNGSQGTSTVTLSATDTAKLVSTLVPAVNDFAITMLASMAQNKVALLDDRTKTENYENSDCKDLGHFAKLVANDARVSKDVQDKAKAVLAALKVAVIAEAHSGKVDTKGVTNATGLVVYFPAKGQTVNPRYAKMDFAAEKWDEFLQELVK